MRADTYHRSVTALLVLLLTAPVLSTLLFSLAQSWGATILPDSLTLGWYARIWQDARFLDAFGHSLLVCLGTLLVTAVIVVPTVFVVFYYFPALESVMNALILVPFVVPPVVTSVGILQIYADGPLPMIGTPWVLVGCYFTIALPFMYRALANRLNGMNLRDLMDAAHLLGASTPRAFLSVVLPNLKKSLMASLFLSFSFLLGDFVFANLLVGTGYETLQVYLYNTRQSSGHLTSAGVMSYYLFTLILTWFATRFSK